MINYKYITSQSGDVEDDDTGVVVNVDIVVQAPEGYNISQEVLDRAVERALDYIFDEGIEEDD